jgi:hypothetical protein
MIHMIRTGDGKQTNIVHKVLIGKIPIAHLNEFRDYYMSSKKRLNASRINLAIRFSVNL